jgi:polysaccharide transporter, PST family
VRALDKGKNLWKGAVYLSLAAVFIKILSAVYRVPYQNIAGDVGFYVYQQVYPFYGIAIVLSTYGFPVIISKLICEGVNDRFRIVKTAFLSLFVVSFIVFLTIFINALPIAKVMGDELLELPLKAISFTFFIIPLLSVLRGYFQGQEDMLPTAMSQVIEQLTRVVVILLFTYFFISNGFGPYAAGLGAAIGSVVGGVFGCLALFLFYRREPLTARQLHQKNKPFCLTTVKIIFIQGTMICFSSLLLIIFQFIDSLTVLRILLENGIELELAKISKGVFDRGQPLVQMGTVITTSFSLVVVPLITKVSLEGRLDLIQKYSSLALRISCLVGFNWVSGYY